jgi:SAM-dependent methyltransferase
MPLSPQPSTLNPTGPSSTRPAPSFRLPRPLLKDIIEWDVRNWSHCLDFWVPVVQTIEPASASVLTIGERNGGISLWLALQGFSVICTDLGGPTPRARELHQEYEVSTRVSYADVSVFSLPYPEASFDIVSCKSMIGGLKLVTRDATTRTLGNQSRAVAEIHRVIKPGGFFLGAENLTGTWFHRKIRYWMKGGRVGWRHLTCAEIDQLFNSFEVVEQQPYGFLGSHFGLPILDFLAAAIDSCACRLLPAHWQYISFIRAKKAQREAAA